MDRLDPFLNRQTGWRRLMLLWLHVSPGALAVGLGSAGLFGPQWWTARTALSVAGWSVAAALPVALLVLALPPVREAGRRGRTVFSWRISAGLAMITGPAVVSEILTHLAAARHSWVHLLMGVATGPFSVLGAIVFFREARRRKTADAAVRGRA